MYNNQNIPLTILQMMDKNNTCPSRLLPVVDLRPPVSCIALHSLALTRTANMELTKLRAGQRKKKQSDRKTKENNMALHRDRKMRYLTIAELDIFIVKEKNLLCCQNDV